MKGETHQQTRARVGRMYAAKRRAKEAKMKAKQAKAETNVHVAPPHVGWILIARKQLSVGSHLYPRGAEVPVKALGKNVEALLSTGHVKWSPPSGSARPTARELPPPVVAKPRPKVEFVEDADVVISWRATKKLMTERYDGNAAAAEDVILGTPEGRRLYLSAQKAAMGAERERLSKQNRGLISVTPNMVNL